MRKFMKKAGLLVIVFLYVFCNIVRAAQCSTDTLQRLADDRTWLCLLHDKNKDTISAYKSNITDHNFFIHPNGQTDAVAELLASYKSFFVDKDKSKICQFPARALWLAKKTGQTVPDLSSCAKLGFYLSQVYPSNISLLLASSDLGRPQSFFGHLMIAFNKIDRANVISYAAMTNDESASNMIIKGLSGGLDGYEMLQPKNEVIRFYNYQQNRDVYEYSLKLSDEQKYILSLHAWELKGIKDSYSFMYNNCSYYLTYHLEIAESKFDFNFIKPWVSPVDILFEVSQKNTIEFINYYPSTSNISSFLRGTLSDVGEDMYKFYTSKKLKVKHIEKSQLADEEKAYILYLAYLRLLENYKKGKIKKVDFENQGDLLLDKVGIFYEGDLCINVPAPHPQISGHKSTKISFYGNDQYKGVSISPAYHGLDDNDIGFVKGQELEILKISLERSRKKTKILLRELTLLNMSSLRAVSAFETPLSWTLDTSYNNDIFSEKDSFQTTMGAGISWMPVKYIHFSFLLHSGLKYSDSLRIPLKPDVRIIISETDYAKTTAEYSYDLSDKLSECKVQQNFYLDSDINFFVRLESNFENDRWTLGFSYYF